MTLDQHIEGILFYKAAPIKVQVICKLFQSQEEEVVLALDTLQKRLTIGATRLIIANNEVELVLAPEFNELIEAMRKEEMKRDIGKAGAETLAIILYKESVTRADIDRIRGVNSSYILRNLLVRGLVEKDVTEKQTRFQITTSLLSHLGITNRTQLVDFEQIMNALDTHELEQETEG